MRLQDIISPKNFATFARRIADGTLSSAGAKVVLAEMVKRGYAKKLLETYDKK